MDMMENKSVICITWNLMRKVMKPPWIEKFLSKEKGKNKDVSLYTGQQGGRGGSVDDDTC
jgi:hypothetical protein